jgi:hypothetical protein
MDSNLLIVLTIFVALTAIAMIAQACALVGMFIVVRKLQEKVDSYLPQVAKILEASRSAVEKAGALIQDVNAHTTAILDMTQSRMTKIDEFLGDATNRAKTQMERAEMVIDDTMNRTQKTVSIVQRSVISPIREVHGVLMGVRATLVSLGRGNRPTVDHATTDEEMFI